MTARATYRSICALFALLLSACSPFRMIDTLTPDDGYRREVAIPFGAGDRRKLDVYHPTNPNGSDAIIVFLYGGAWKGGRREDYRFVAQPFVAAGFTTVVPDYRLYPEVRFPAFVEDAAAAVAWVQRELVKDSAGRRIVLVGHSAGAHIAAMLALDPRYLDAEGLSPEILRGWVGLAGPYAFNPLNTRSTNPIFQPVADDIDQGRPVAFARAGAPPALLLHGTNDTTVYTLNSEQLEAALRAAGSPVTYKPLEKVGHIGIVLAINKPGMGGAPVLEEIAGFVKGL